MKFALFFGLKRNLQAANVKVNTQKMDSFIVSVNLLQQQSSDGGDTSTGTEGDLASVVAGFSLDPDGLSTSGSLNLAITDLRDWGNSLDDVRIL